MNPTELPDTPGSIAALAPEIAAAVARVGGDLALVIGADGVIRSVAKGQNPLSTGPAGWVGRPWAETVCDNTRGKVELLLDEARTQGYTRRREVNHRSDEGIDIPMAYAAVQLGAHGPLLAVGRDLRTVSAIQQRFVEAQRDLEQDYWKRRQADTRYRLLFQVLHDAVLLVDARTLKVLEANQAAEELFGTPPSGLNGQMLLEQFDFHSRPALSELLGTADLLGRSTEIRLRAIDPGHLVEVAATPFRSEGQPLLLVRARETGAKDGARSPADDHQRLVEFVQHTPDAVVITDTTGRVLMANAAFAALCGLGPEGDLRGRALDALLLDENQQWDHLLKRARQRGIVVQEPVNITTRNGAVAVEAAAAMLAEGDQECIGFSLRRRESAPATIGPIDQLLQAALSKLAADMGSRPLDAMLSDVNTLSERFLLDHALRQAGGDRGQAAAALGLSVEALAARLLRHGPLPT